MKDSYSDTNFGHSNRETTSKKKKMFLTGNTSGLWNKGRSTEFGF